jgi:hypothetical protein
MKMDWAHLRLVVHGVLAAFVSAALTTLAGVVATPDLTYQQLVHVAITGGIVGCAGYLVKSPRQ